MRSVARLFRSLALVAVLAVLQPPAGHAQYANGDGTGKAAPRMRFTEQVMMLPKAAIPSRIDLEATVFKPSGEGPFPLVVINHGKAPGRPFMQGRARFAAQSAEFLRRGYVVVLPMRQGFARSGGAYVGGSCDIETNGLMQADDVVATLDYMATLPYVDMERIVVIGQSQGGLTTMAFSTIGYPGVRGVVNFAGGLRNLNCPDWEERLVDVFASYGSLARYPSLWVYGDNDSYWPVPLPGRLFNAFKSRATGPGANARMFDVGEFGMDSHRLFSQREGIPVWLPEVGDFFRSLGLPFDSGT
ncbi:MULTISPECIES: dienelactone hydrolase family protein [Cupriavidus]|uniref:dienelactone hydrolase family protein n=1 Tax=Cupriavidus sp. DF5525 TaxID=3160989 RepID=UPI0003B0AF6B|nr:signal peptide protein [Ralstonia pickettii DTP0602]